MNWNNHIAGLMLCVTLAAPDVVLAQPPGFSPDEFMSRMVRRLDRDEDGMVTPEEFERASTIRDYLVRQRVDLSRPIPMSSVNRYLPGLAQEMQQRMSQFGGGGTPIVVPDSRGSDSNRRDEEQGSRRSRRDEGGSRSRDGGESQRSTSGNSSSSKSKTRNFGARYGARASSQSLALPAQYAARDTNHDGQIGMYEWSKTDLSTFAKLDLNGDGFLVPRELGATPTTSTRTGSTTTTSPSTQSPPAQPTVIKPSSTSDSKPVGPSVDPKSAAAETAFTALDVNKDGALDSEEFGRSRVVRRMFERANIEIKDRISKKDFIEKYLKVSE